MDQKGHKGDKEGSWEAGVMIYIRNDGGIIRVASMETEVDRFTQWVEKKLGLGDLIEGRKRGVKEATQVSGKVLYYSQR